jgi:hypothetical protein
MQVEQEDDDEMARLIDEIRRMTDEAVDLTLEEDAGGRDAGATLSAEQ